MAFPQKFKFLSSRNVYLARLHFLLNTLTWLMMVAFLFVSTNTGSVHSQLNPMMYPSLYTGNTNSLRYGTTRQLSLYPMSMRSSQFGNTGYGVPGITQFGSNGRYPSASMSQFGYNPSRPQIPLQSMGAYYPSTNNMARSAMGQFGFPPMQSMMFGSMPPMMGSNMFGQPPQSSSGSMQQPYSNNNMGRPPPMNMPYGNNMNNTGSFGGAPSTPRYY